MFQDNDQNAGKRAEFMTRHLEFLRSHAEQISAAGPLKDPETGLAAGGLWLVRANGCEEVAALVKADPFWPTGLRKSFTVLEWTKVHPLETMRPGA